MADTTLRFRQPAKPLSNFEKAMQASAGNPSTFRSEFDALNAGFTSAAAQTQNRIMRNQLEEKANRLGVPLSEAYAKAGDDLTNNQALQSAWNQLTVPAPAAQVTTDPGPPSGGGETTEGGGDTGGEETETVDPLAGFKDMIGGLTNTLTTSLAEQRKMFEGFMTAQNTRMEDLQNQMIRSASLQNRPTTMGVKTASGSSGNAMQIARRGVSGAFGRRGLRISSLNV